MGVVRRRRRDGRRHDLAVHAATLERPPIEHPQRPESVPTARSCHRGFEIEVDSARIDAVEEPSAVGLPLRPHDVDGLGHLGARVVACTAEVVKCPQHVVVPVVREGELEVRRVDDLPVLFRRNRRRSSRYCSPLRRASVTSAVAPLCCSNWMRPSSTLIVVSNDDRTDPFSASQFQPPSPSRSPTIRSTI